MAGAIEAGDAPLAAVAQVGSHPDRKPEPRGHCDGDGGTPLESVTP